MKRSALVAAVVCLAAGAARAGTIVIGGSDLLTGGDATQLATWLGEGDLALTNVYDTSAWSASSASAFHSAADGIGRTFSLIEVLDGTGARIAILGGYNPKSWDSHGHYHYDSDGTAFIFNLTTLERRAKSGYAHETYNELSFGPTFGAGYDLHVGSDSYVNGAYSYGSGAGSNLLGTGPGQTFFTAGAVEIFTIAAATTAAVPLPSASWMGLGGLAVLAVIRIRTRSSRGRCRETK